MTAPELLTERVTIRLAASELRALEAAAKRDHERKVSSLARRILLASLSDKTFTPGKN